MSKHNEPNPFPLERPSLLAVVAWFSAWAGLSGVLAFQIGLDLGFREDLPPYIVGSLVIAGGISGWILNQPLRNAVVQKRRVRAAFLGLTTALIALEMAVTFVILLTQHSGSDEVPFTVAWLFAPLFASPLLLTAGPLSGLGLVAAAGWTNHRSKNLPDVLTT